MFSSLILAQMEKLPVIQGIIFDLDGTLVDSRLDFASMREEIGMPAGQPILEHLEKLPPGPEKDRCWSIVCRHEHEGALRATLMPGVRDLLDQLERHGLPRGILTRNLGAPTQLTLERLQLRSYFSHVITREEAPPKPHPGGILKICQAWGVDPALVIFVGDYLFDIQAGKNAGSRTVLYLKDEKRPEYAGQADLVVSDFKNMAENLSTLISKSLKLRLPLQSE